MPWVRIDEEFPEHPKVLAAGPLGMAMQVAALCYCNRHLTDGFIPRAAVPKLLNLEGLGMRMWRGEVTGSGEDAAWQLVVADLIDAGLWTEERGGYRIHDYHDYQPSREHVLEVRKVRAEVGRKGGQAKAARQGPEQVAKQPASKLPSKPEANEEAKLCPVPVPVPPVGDPWVTGVPPTQGEMVVTVAGSETTRNRPVGIHPAMRRQVFDTWHASLPPGTSRRLTPARDKAIQARLREFPLADCLDAAAGWQQDPWPDRAQHNDITVLFRPSNFERMRDLARHGPPRQLSKEQRQMYQTHAEMTEWARQEDERAGNGMADHRRPHQRELPPPAAQG